MKPSLPQLSDPQVQGKTTLLNLIGGLDNPTSGGNNDCRN